MSRKKKKVTMHAKYPILRNEKTLRETCNISVIELLRYQNTKTHEYHYIWRNIKKKKCKLSVFNIVRYHNAKMHAYPISGTKRDFQKRFYSLFMSLLGPKTMKSMESTLHGKIKHYEKRLLLVFLSFFTY